MVLCVVPPLTAAEAQRGQWAEVMDHTNAVLTTFEEGMYTNI